MALLGTLTSGVSALKTFSKSLEVIGNNIANVNTTGYKGSQTSLSDSFSNTLRAASNTDGAKQIGTGVQIEQIETNFSQGSLTGTGKITDLAVSGNGYFMVKDGSGAYYLTRDGSFHFDDAGRLLNAQDMSVLDSTGREIVAKWTDPTGAQPDVPYSQLSSVTIGTDGTLTCFKADGTSSSTQKVGLMAISDESKLMKGGGNLWDFGATGATVPTAAAPSVAGANGLGKIESGELELSNVDLTEQFSDLITAQRSFQAASRVITVSDSVLEEIVNLKR